MIAGALLRLAACAAPADTSAKEGVDSAIDSPAETASDSPSDTGGDSTLGVDSDGDGWGEDDCNDADPMISPGATEVCNGVDDDCDGRVDFDDDVPDDRPTIQNAIYEAQDGDTICVASGTYAESLDFLGRSVRVVGWGGSTTLDAGGDYDGVVIQWGEEVEIEGFRIVGASEHGIRVDGSTLRLRSVEVSGNVCEEYYGCSGVGLLLVEATLELEDVVVRDNTADSTSAAEYGIGIYMSDTQATWRRVIVSGNEAAGGLPGVTGGGVYVARGTLDAENLIVAGNRELSGSGWSAGGGLFLYGSVSARISHAAVVGNSVTGTGGGLAVGGGADVVVVASVIADNEADAGGAAIEVADAESVVTVSWSDVYGNVGSSGFIGLGDPSGTDGNFAEDPSFLDASAPDAADWDLHPGAGSPLIDAGDPAEVDVDGTRADVGAFGGPEGSGW